MKRNRCSTSGSFARAMWRINREQSRIELFKRAAAIRTTHLRAHDREPIFRIEKMRGTASDLERALRKVSRFRDSFGIDHSDDNRDAMLFEALESSKLRDRDQRPIDIQGVKSLAFIPARGIGVKSFARFHHRRKNFERAFFRRRLDLFHDRSHALLFDWQIAVRTKLDSSLGKKQSEEMVNLRHGRDR